MNLSDLYLFPQVELDDHIMLLKPYAHLPAGTKGKVVKRIPEKRTFVILFEDGSMLEGVSPTIFKEHYDFTPAEAYDYISEHSGHHCLNSHWYQFNIKLRKWFDIPEEIQKIATYDQLLDIAWEHLNISYLCFVGEICDESVLKQFYWISDHFQAGSMGGWLVVKDGTRLLEDYEYALLSAEESDDEYVLQDYRYFCQEIQRRAQDFLLIEKIILHYLDDISQTLSSLEFWEQMLSENEHVV